MTDQHPYSNGFQNQSNRKYYDRLVFKLIELLTSRLLGPPRQPSDLAPDLLRSWEKKIVKIHLALKTMETVNDGSMLAMSPSTQALYD